VTATTAQATGTGSLIRFTVRRDRVRMVVWVVAILLLVGSTVASIKGLYPTQHDLDLAARASEDNAAAIAFNGPPQALDTLGGQMAFQVGAFGLVTVALMSLFMTGRLTRGEEEAGRLELLRSLPLGADAPTVAALATVAGMDLAVGALVGATLIGLGLPTVGSVVFGLSFGLLGLFFVGVTLVAAQVSENTRVVYGIAGSVVGASFLLRAVGDIGDGSLSWLSPIGWAQKTRPFAGEEWWPFALLLLATGILFAVAAALARRRDVGAGLVAPRPGPASAGPGLGSAAGLARRLQRGSLIGWAATLLFFGIAYGSVADSVNDFVRDNQAMADIIAAQGGGSIVDSYLAMSFRVLALLGAGFAVQATLRLRSEETSLHAEQVLVAATSRPRWAAGHLAIALVGSVLILVVAGLSLGLTDAAVTGETDVVLRSLGASVVYAPAVWVLVGTSFALVGLAPRAAPAAWAVLAACFVVGMFGQLLELPQWVSDASPFQHVPQLPAADFAVVPLLLLTVLAAALTGAGLVGLRRRDIA
jgi:ABC-2 type transport system permease protein